MSFFVNTMVCGFSLYQILAFFLIYSCLGWCLEVIYAAVSTGQLVNRGFLNGPVCPIYGFGMIIVLFTLSPLADNLLLLYIGGVILPSVLELVGGWALYKLYHTRWWDYSDFPFNIGGYICLEFSLLWGVGTIVVMKAVHPVIAGFVEMVPQMVGFVLMCILYACYAADVVVTAFAASDLARELDALEKVADSGHHRHGCGPEDGREPPAAQAGGCRGPGQCRQTEPPGCRCRPARQGRRGHGGRPQVLPGGPAQCL